ncbi:MULTISPECIES: type II secretion system F family protein [unclassified Luteococcus]|uniref:type II secretion system F family protein n=1 Tax=unclassified Luteococcus TaxID=2639923 RepID=UPI00313A870D
MNPVIAGLSAFCLVAGLLLAVDGLRRRPRALSTGNSTPLWTTVDNWWVGCSRTRRIHLLGTLAGAVVAFLVTGWALLLVAVPLVVIGLPALLSEPSNRDLVILEALDRWVRGLAASLPTGKSVTDAIRATAPQAPEQIRGPVQVMVARLDARWTTRESLVALADDLDSADADAVLASLILAAERGGVGATAILTELAESIQARLRALREIEAERAKPRVVVRQVTMISLVAITLALLLQPSFFRAYRTPIGQVLMLGQLLAYAGSLLAMRRMTIPRRRERIIRRRPTQPLGVADA